MSTQFDRIFEGLSKNSLTLEDACRVLYSESQVSPESMRECCERIEIELSHGRISSDAAQLLLDALGERSPEEPQAAAVEEMWVDVPLEPLVAEAVRPGGKAGEPAAEVDLTMDDLLAALDRRGAPLVKPSAELKATEELATSVEWMEWEPEEPAAPFAPSVSSAAAPVAEVEVAQPVNAAAPAGALPEAIAVPLEQASTPVVPALRAADIIPLVILTEPEPVPVPLEAAAPEVGGSPVVVVQAEPSEMPLRESALAAGLTPPAAQSVAEASDPTALSDEPAQVDDLIPVSGLPEETPEAAGGSVATLVASEPAEVVVAAAGSAEPQSVVVLMDPEGLDIDAAQATDEAIEEVFAPRVEHVLRESSAIRAGALLKDRYRILGALAPGGLGQLFEAIDTQASGAPRVVLKLIEVDWQEEPRAFETLQAIVRHVRRLRHPNILAILDIDRDDKHAIIAMEPLRGAWLSSLVREVRGRGVGYAVAWNIISGIANGLAYAHQHGAVHSELNPHMVFLTETGQVKIVGFGLAHAMPMSTEPLAELDGLTLRGYADAYCATHWILGSVPQGVDDLYPLGIIAYELLTGAHPFNRASPGAAASRQLQPLPIPGLDRRIRRVIERCLSFDRKDRPVSGASFLAHIEPTEKLLELVRDRFN